jgi:hypothetical protein
MKWQSMKKSTLSLAFALLLGASSCPSQTPGVRNGHNMVYYFPSHSLLLFGGADQAKVYGDTWTYSQGQWEKVADNGPSPRTFPCMTMADGYVLLFGGNAVLFGNDQHPVHYLDDTWIFRDGKWAKWNDDGPHPSARAEAAMAYDPLRKKVVLFGGRMAGAQWLVGDTWEFDGKKWNEMQAMGPTARSGAAMFFDQTRNQILLSGGNPVIAKEKDYNGPLWAWDGKAWESIRSTDSLIFNACIAYNTKESYLLRFGGWNGRERLNDTWIFKGTEWTKLPLRHSPAARNHSILVYDLIHNAFLLFGGHDGDNVFGDMWSFQNGQWQLIYKEGPVRRVENGH